MSASGAKPAPWQSKRPRLIDKPQTEQGSTRSAILAAAERLFASEGLDAATMRQITAEAGVNLAAVNYHFGSKLDLAHAVLDRLGEEVCRNRLVALDALERGSGGSPALETMVRIFIAPYFAGDEGRRRLLVRLLQAHRLNPTELTVQISAAHFDPFAAHFTRLLAAVLPNLPRAAVLWRYHFMVGAVLSTAGDIGAGNRLARLSGGAADAANHAELVEEVVAFIIGALTCADRDRPVPPRPRTRRR